MIKIQNLSTDEVETLRYWLTYNELSGSVTDWRGRRRDKPGSDLHPYATVSYAKKTYYVHRLAFVLMGLKVPEVVDHVDGNPRNNKWNNLRPSTAKLNAQNRPKHRAGIPSGIRKYMCRYKVELMGKDGTLDKRVMVDTVEEAILVQAKHNASTRR